MISTSGWYLLSTDASMSWTDAKIQWGMGLVVPGHNPTSEVYNIIYELSGQPILNGDSLTQNNWKPTDVISNPPTMSPYSGYWVNIISTNSIEMSTLFEKNNGDKLSIYISNNVLSPDSYNTDISINDISSVRIGNNVTSLNNTAFFGATNMKNIRISESVSDISTGAFWFTELMEEYIVDTPNTTYKASDGILFDISLNKIIQYPAGNTRSSYDIPSNATIIDKGAFHSASHLTKIMIHNNVTHIEDFAFYNCSSLSSVTFDGTTIPVISSTAFGYESNKYITAYYTKNITTSDITYLKTIFHIVIGPDLFTIDSAYDGKYSYMVENGSSSLDDKYSIISVNPSSNTVDNTIELKINYSNSSYNNYSNYRTGVLLVGPGETPTIPSGTSNANGGNGGASIYATMSGINISDKTITLRNASTDSSYTSMMNILPDIALWNCSNNLTQIGGISHTTVKSSDGGKGGNTVGTTDLSGTSSNWTNSDQVSFVDSSVMLTGYGGGGGGTEYGSLYTYGKDGYQGNGGEGAYYGPNGNRAGPGDGGGGCEYISSNNWGTPSPGGDGLVYFYIGFKHPTGEIPP